MPKSLPPSEQRTDIVVPLEPLSNEAQRRLDVVQRLHTYKGQANYRIEQERAAAELGVSVRNLRRLQRQYRETGIVGVKRQGRSDEGHFRVDEAWQAYIVKAYQEGNRGQRATSRAQVAKLVKSHAAELGKQDYPSRPSVYRVLESEIKRAEQKQRHRSIGWQGEELKLRTKEGIELDIKYSNQVWQADHTRADIMVVDSQGEPLGCPTLTTVVDTYSRCIVGIHLGMSYPSAAVTCLALRHAILPKQYSHEYEPNNLWESYGVPQYLYTDAGSDFTSSHIDQVANSIGIVLCLRRRPSDGGIVERPFGTLNTEFFSTLPGYTTRRLKPHKKAVEADARLTLEQLEGLLIRYIVDNYNQQPDTRTGEESRMARWSSGLMSQAQALEERELDLLLMRQDRRRVYRGGYIRFANLLYKGEYLEGYVGQQVVLRYNPSDITSLYIYRSQGELDIFLTRAHAQNLETERLSLSEAKAISRRLRQVRQEITNESVLLEIRDRTRFVADVLSENRAPAVSQSLAIKPESDCDRDSEEPLEQPAERRPLPSIRVYDYEQLRQEHGSL
ncbi:MAG: transposase [Phormidesmis priestleyi]|uniref:Transposase n=1 Tax=Phormidesmis priestleyi TaxID=268141 RepID=A0A2W4ZRC8_9CYAN|nr:MAG: transposase [Phormidesmis priestleyi]